MIIEEEKEEMLAAARRLPNTAQVQLPDQPADIPSYVRTSSAGQPAAADPNASNAPAAQPTNGVALRPIDTSAKPLDLTKTADTPATPTQTQSPATEAAKPTESKPQAEVRLGSDPAELKAGQKIVVPIMVSGSELFRSAVFGLKFDEKQIAVRAVKFGDVFGSGIANTNAAPFLNQGGRMFVSLSLPEGTAKASSGILAYVEIEALKDGKPVIALVPDVLNLLAADGRNFILK
jgi:hypothetical protein